MNPWAVVGGVVPGPVGDAVSSGGALAGRSLVSVVTARRGPIGECTAEGWMPPSTIKAKTVYLTFDDGPQRGTSAVLDALDLVCGKATFFVTGENHGSLPKGKEQQLSLIKRMISRGHVLGNHVYEHLPQTKSQYRQAYGNSPDTIEKYEQFEENWLKNEEHFAKLLGDDSFRFHFARLPGDGRTFQKLVRGTEKLRMDHVSWGFEFSTNSRFSWLKGNNWQGLLGVRATRAGWPRDGAVILFHDRDWAGKRELLTQLLVKFMNQGYVFRVLDENKTYR